MCTWKYIESYPEKFFNQFLLNNKYKIDDDYIREYRVSYYRIDFYFPKKKLAIEIDGRQHYFYKRQYESDVKKDELLKSMGINVIRIPWKELCNNTKVKLKDILNMLDQYSNPSTVSIL